MNAQPNSFAEWLASATAGLQRNVRQRLELELRAHYEEAYEELVASGLSAEEANRKALAMLGDARESQEVFREEYAAEMPWERDFLPKKPADAEYGYLKGSKLVGCSRDELVELCKGKGMSPGEVTLAWTPDSEQVVPVERIPFLFDAIKETRRKSARWELIQSGMWAVMMALEFSTGGVSNLRHLTLFLGMMTILPAISGFRALRAAHALTPERLAGEAAETSEFGVWSGLQSARLTMALILICVVVWIMQLVGMAFAGWESAALDKSATLTGEWWRLLTCVFLHATFMHLFFNAIGLGVFAHLVEVAIGRLFLPVVFFVSAVSGSFFSLLLNPETSIGASGGVMGLAGFLFAVIRNSKVLPVAYLQRIVVSVCCFTAAAGIVAFDLFDSAAHLGGLLAGLAMGYMIRDPKKVASSRAFKVGSAGAGALLVAGAGLAIFLMVRPAPKEPKKYIPPQPKAASQIERPTRYIPPNYYFPSRDPATPPTCIDIEPFSNANLKTYWQVASATNFANRELGYSLNLKDLPTGLQSFNGVSFDVRRLIQLRGSNTAMNFPSEVRGIRVGQRAVQLHFRHATGGISRNAPSAPGMTAERLHFLHATGGVAPDGTTVGKYLVHFKNGTEREIPIKYGEDLREWHARADAERIIKNGEVAWSVTTCHETRLFHSVWTNDLPTEAIQDISFVSSLTECFPFVVAITVDPPAQASAKSILK